MRLPDDPKEKVKILILVGIGGVAVVYTLIAAVVKPLLHRKEADRAEIAELEDQLASATRDVNRMWKDRVQNTQALETIVDISNEKNYLLHPRLGNYELGAREFVESLSQSTGVPVESVREIGIIQLPTDSSQQTERTLTSYNVRVNVKCGIHALINLLTAIEDANPYVCVSGVSIAAGSDDPAKHQINFELQWPIWSDPTMAEDMERRLEEAKNIGEKTPPRVTKRTSAS